jgi:hypothetical protein
MKNAKQQMITRMASALSIPEILKSELQAGHFRFLVPFRIIFTIGRFVLHTGHFISRPSIHQGVEHGGWFLDFCLHAAPVGILLNRPHAIPAQPPATVLTA